MIFANGTIVPQTPEVDNLIAELGPKVAKTAATVVFSDGSLCSFVVDGDLFQAQNHIATYFLASEIKRVTFKAITRRDDVETCPGLPKCRSGRWALLVL